MNIKKFYKHKYWYKKTRVLLMRKYKKDYRLFSALLASTSPRFQVKRNYNTTLLIFNDYIKNKNSFLIYAVKNKKRFIKKYKLLPAHYNNIIRSLSHNFTNSKKLVLGGNKVNAFYNNIIGNYNHVTIDIWMLRYFKNKKSQCNLSEYRYYTRIIKKLSKKLKMQPCELQAVLWFKIRYQLNQKKDANFYQYIQPV